MSIGPMITHARKRAGFSIEDLSALTKIPVPLLLEMESNNFINCGGETYLRGHIKIIASKLGVDPQILLSIFDEENLEVQRTIRNLLIENSEMRASEKDRKVFRKAIVTISVSLLTMAGVAWILLSNS